MPVHALVRQQISLCGQGAGGGSSASATATATAQSRGGYNNYPHYNKPGQDEVGRYIVPPPKAHKRLKATNVRFTSTWGCNCSRQLPTH